MRRYFKIIALFLLSFLCSRIWAQKAVLPDFHADPSAHEWEGKYWIYPSHDIPGSIGWDMTDWHCFSSMDLVNWTDHGVILSLNDINWANRKAYAPDIAMRNQRYYFYFPADYQIGVAMSDRPYGPFTDVLGHPLIYRMEDGIEAMDPSVFIDTDSSVYLYYGGHSTAGVVMLNPDMISRNGKIIPLHLKGFSEGIWVHKKDSLYYFSYPMDTIRDGKINQLLVYSTSRSPFGPFEYKGIILDNHSRNVHHSIAKFNGQWYLFYHIEGPSPYERRVCIEYLHYGPDGSILPVEMSQIGINPIVNKNNDQ